MCISLLCLVANVALTVVANVALTSLTDAVQVSSHVAHEGNAEETFSLSGRLSNDNTLTQPGFLATLVRINKNRHLYNPTWNAILGAYKRKHRKLPTLGDDVTDEEGSQDDNSDASDGAVSD